MFRSVDEQAISQYFPVKTVVPAILKLYEDLLGLEIVKMDKSEGETWHEGEYFPFSARHNMHSSHDCFHRG